MKFCSWRWPKILFRFAVRWTWNSWKSCTDNQNEARKVRIISTLPFHATLLTQPLQVPAATPPATEMVLEVILSTVPNVHLHCCLIWPVAVCITCQDERNMLLRHWLSLQLWSDTTGRIAYLEVLQYTKFLWCCSLPMAVAMCTSFHQFLQYDPLSK